MCVGACKDGWYKKDCNTTCDTSCKTCDRQVNLNIARVYVNENIYFYINECKLTQAGFNNTFQSINNTVNTQRVARISGDNGLFSKLFIQISNSILNTPIAIH